MYMKGRRTLINVGFPGTFELTRYELAQTKGCWDLRMDGNNSPVKVIQPNGKVTYQPATRYEDIPKRKRDYNRYLRDRKVYEDAQAAAF